MHSASLLGQPLKALWSAYERQLERRPIVTQMTTSAILWGSGDLIAQRLEHGERQQQQRQQQWQRMQAAAGKKGAAAPPKPSDSQLDSMMMSIDWRRAVFTGLFGSTFVGPVGHFWYQAIDAWCRRLVPQGGAAFIGAKVALDTAAMGPLYVAAFFAWGCALIDRTGVPEFRRKMAVDFWPTLAAEVSVWPFVQAVNFSVVPLKHQLLVINAFTIMDAAFMSWTRGQEDWVAKVMRKLQGKKGEEDASAGGGKQLKLQMQPLLVADGKGKGV